MHTFVKIFFLCTVFISVSSRSRKYFAMNENWVCNVKRSCNDCLRFSQCSWCKAENKCYSRKLSPEDYCRDNFIDYHNHGCGLISRRDFFQPTYDECVGNNQAVGSIKAQSAYKKVSLLDNAKCSCSSEIEENCTPPDIFTDQKCSGRGACLCGRCVCDQPDTENPTKMVVGEYCEYDNFSCDGPKCNEGPYHYLQNGTISIDSVMASLFSDE